MPEEFWINLKKSLPDDINPEELLPDMTKELRDYVPDDVAIKALFNCKRINWQAYLENNADVMKSNINPYQHFIKYGIYEGRKLTSWHPLKKEGNHKQPLVSIIIASYNNEKYLKRCLESAINQSLDNIEIIVVDDASTDNSGNIIESYGLKDRRIKPIFNKINSSTYMTRKIGVNNATGQYIMFMDSDDFLCTDACKIAYSAINKGYDIVKFGAHVVNAANANKKSIEIQSEYLNRVGKREYHNDEIITAIFVTHELPCTLWTRIILSEICVEAYNEIGDKYILGSEDVLAQIAISKLARSTKCISDRLYNWNFGIGLYSTTNKEKLLKYMLDMAKTGVEIYNYSESNYIELNNRERKLLHCSQVIEKWINVVSNDDSQKYFNIITDMYSVEIVIETIIRNYYNLFTKIADKIKHFNIKFSKCIKNIGIYMPKYDTLEASIIISNFIELANLYNYNIYLFTENINIEHNFEFKNINIVYLTPTLPNQKSLIEHCIRLLYSINNNNIDIMIHTGSDYRRLFVDLILLYSLNIPLISFFNRSYTFSFITKYAVENDNLIQILSCVPCVICNSIADELFLRMRGVNSWLYYCKYYKYDLNIYGKKKDKIITLVNTHSPTSKLNETFSILKKLFTYEPWIRCIILLESASNKERIEIYNLLKKYDINDKVKIVSHFIPINKYINDCFIIISTSHGDSYLRDIQIANEYGMYCIMYEQYIDEAINNNVIMIKNNDQQAFVKKIISLFNSKECIVSNNSFRNKHNIDSLHEIIEKFKFYTPYRSYSIQTYHNIIKNASYCAENF